MNVSSVKNLNGEVFSAVQDASLTNVVQTNSGNWQDITAYQSNSASYLTAHQDLSDYYTTAEAETLSSMLSGAIDYVSANAGDEFPVSADEAIQYVQTNSGTIDDVNTSYQTNSGTFLTAHQAISADEWNDCYDNVNTNSGAWGGEALPITGRDGIDLEIDNGTLYIGASALTGKGGNPEVENYVVTNSAAIDETVGCVQTNSASWGVGVSHDNTLSGDGTTARPLGIVNGYNETVLFEGNLTGNGSTAQLSEPITNFERIKVYGHTDDGIPYPWFTEFYTNENNTMNVGVASNNQGWAKWFNFTITTGGLYTNVTGKVLTFDSTTWGNLDTYGLTKIVGILRKPLVSNTYTAEYVGDAAAYTSDSNISYIELQPNTYNIQYSAHYELGMADRYKCGIGLYKSTEPYASEYVYSASYSAVSENTKIVDISGTLEIDTSIGYDRFYPLRDSSNVFGKVSATITAQCYV